MKQKSIISDWSIEDRGTYYALTGIIIKHDKLEMGDVLHSSMLERIDFAKGIAETRNTIYKLIS